MKEKDDDFVMTASSLAAEEVKHKGFSVVDHVLPDEILAEASLRLDGLLKVQEQEVGRENIYDISEENIVRFPLAYDDFFLWKFLNNPALKNVVSELLGTYHQLHSQNAILIHPHTDHRFSSWHRDLVPVGSSAKTTSVTVMYCLQDLSLHTGGPIVLPFSHKMEKLPSADYIKQNQVGITAKAGSMIVIDSLLYHRAGPNSSTEPRKSIKQVYTNPHLKQEIDVPAMLKGDYSTDPYFSMVLGYNHSVPDSVKDYRLRKIRKRHH